MLGGKGGAGKIAPEGAAAVYGWMARGTAGWDVIVVGGGIAGLAAARELGRQGRRVVLLEARPRLGGRIHTARPAGWSTPVELGAEFVHGGNPAIWDLLRRGHIKTVKVSPRHWLGRPAALEPIPDVERSIARITRQIVPARAGRKSFAGYFRAHPPRGSAEDWALARGFVEGFEAAPVDAISARSLAGEAFEEDEQFRVPGGYDRAVETLARECRQQGVRIILKSPVSSIDWRSGLVRAAARGHGHTAPAAIITLPLGVLQARSGPGRVRFRPGLGDRQMVIDRMGVGHVYRLSLRLRAAAWKALWPAGAGPAPPADFGFIHSQLGGIPVWWSLTDEPVLVAWAGGPAARALRRLEPRERRRRALRSLAGLIGAPVARLERAVAGWQHWDWTGDPFSRGAYSFTAAGQDLAARKFRAPLRGTLFFAGEATADGAEVGTVHGALASGIRAAAEVAAAG